MDIKNNIKLLNYKEKKIACFSGFILTLVLVASILTLFKTELINASNNALYSDFFDVIGFSINHNPYQGSNGSIYPLVAHVLLFPFSLIMNYSKSANLIVYTPEWCNIVRGQSNTINGAIAIYSYYTFNLILLLFLSNNLLKSSITNKIIRFLFLLSLLLSGAVINYLSRGNIILSVLIFILIFLNFYNSKNKYLKYLALFCLSLAIAVKIYPLVFSVILFREKKYKDLIITIAISLALFFIPFLFIPFHQFELFINNFTKTAFINNTTKLFFTSEVSLKNLFALVNNYTNNKIENLLLILFYFSFFFILISSTFSSLFIKKKWKLFVLIITLCNLIPNISFRYILILYIIGIIEFIKEEEKDKFDILFLILFIIIFNPIQFGSNIENGIIGYKFHCLIIIIASLTFNFLFIVEGFKDFLSICNARRTKSSI